MSEKKFCVRIKPYISTSEKYVVEYAHYKWIRVYYPFKEKGMQSIGETKKRVNEHDPESQLPDELWRDVLPQDVQRLAQSHDELLTAKSESSAILKDPWNYFNAIQMIGDLTNQQYNAFREVRTRINQLTAIAQAEGEDRQ